MTAGVRLTESLEQWQELVATGALNAVDAREGAGAQADAVEADQTAGRAARALHQAAQEALAAGLDQPDPWRRFLEVTGDPVFLSALPDRDARHAWAETMFAALRLADFGLERLLDWRVRTRPERVFLQDLGRAGEPSLTFRQVQQRCRHLAAHFLGPSPGPRPRAVVGILAPNTLDGVIADLACLLHDIPVAPLNIQEDSATLAWICDRLGIADLVVDGPEMLQRALDVRDQVRQPFTIHLLQDDGAGAQQGVRLLAEEVATLGMAEAERRLAERPRLALDDPCTVLFTSGSTGRPKGIAFTPFNLVSKRFARHAALPAVGRDESLLCFLPLYHTFGRYLELMGMLYWGGTYVFAGNPSSDALLAGMRKVRPTGLISVPLRWQQIRERAEEIGSDRAALDAITGGHLRWGLSAAGWLSPATFRWFHEREVALCSGFGMTEGTGGLTMTPPGEYVEESVGVPLPGVRTRIGKDGELQVSGPYVARYLPPDGAPGDLTPESHPAAAGEFWLGTGDLFQELPGGHLQIVDRIKDIYKNNRGQTVAPRKVESRFAGVPGIQRSFLAGDGRPFNVLLIVPDRSDPVLRDLAPHAQHLYFRRVIRQANLDLAAYERVVNFAILDRDFDAAQGELTSKGTLRRKAIAENFKALLDGLYHRRTLVWGRRRLLLPDWIVRDLGLLEDEIQLSGDQLVNRRSGARLQLAERGDGRWLQIGDLLYRVDDEARDLDLGLFARQPLLWVGNPALQTLLPCRDVWDTRLVGVAEQVRLPERQGDGDQTVCPPRRDDRLGQLDAFVRDTLFGPLAVALPAIAALEKRLPHALPHEALLIRRRLEALAYHNQLELRCEAYRILVLDAQEPDYGRHLTSFVASGQPFLSPQTIEKIAREVSESRRLMSFRRRLHDYRQQIAWPVNESERAMFRDLLQLLVDFAHHHPEHVATVRRELFAWVLLRRDPELAAHAGILLEQLTAWHQTQLAARVTAPHAWTERLAYQDGLATEEIAQLQRVLGDATFLAESAAVLFDADLDPADVPRAGIWVSRTLSQPFASRYRVSINTAGGRHHGLLLILREDLDDPGVLETFQRVAAIRGWPSDSPVVPRLGALRPDLGAASLAFAGGLSVWDRIRLHGMNTADAEAFGRAAWRRLIVAGMATCLTAWAHSGREIVPGMIHPANVIVPDRDWQRDSLLLSLAGWRPYTGPLDLARPLLNNFLRLVVNHHPALRELVDEAWLAEAYAEALGPQEGRALLGETIAALEREPAPYSRPELVARLRRTQRELAARYRPTLAVESAIARFHHWRALNPEASARARSDQVESLVRLYRLDREGEAALLTLFGATYLAEAAPAAVQACEQLVARLFQHPGLRAARTVELGDLQAALPEPEDREALGAMVFPRTARGQRPAVEAIGDRAREHLVLVTRIRDDQQVAHQVREPRDAAEVGRLYRLFLQSGFALEIGEFDFHLVVLDERGQLVGGVVWRIDAAGEPHLDGVVVSPSLRSRGLARELIADLCRRLASEGHSVLRTHFSLLSFFARLGFQVDQQRGGLVRRLL